MSTIKDKFLSAFRWTIIFLQCLTVQAKAVDSPFSHRYLGECFANSNAAIAALGGDPEETDGDIILAPIVSLADSNWIIDKTSGHNFQWFLLEREKLSNRSCISLYIPFASEVASTTNSGIVIITAKTQASPGTASYEMIFRKSLKLKRFVPFSCFKSITPATGVATPRQMVDCLAVGVD